MKNARNTRRQSERYHASRVSSVIKYLIWWREETIYNEGIFCVVISAGYKYNVKLSNVHATFWYFVSKEKKEWFWIKLLDRLMVISHALCIFFASRLGNATSPSRRPQSSDLKLTYRFFRYSHPPIHQKSAHVAVVGLVEINWEDFRANGAPYKLTATSQAIYGCRNFHFISRFISKRNVCQLATEILNIQQRNIGLYSFTN